jgi:hypothetical protein
MEALIAYLRSLLDLSPRQGWIFLLIGSAMLTLVHLGAISKDEIAAGWLALFWLSAVSGAMILLVSAGAEVWGALQNKRAEKAKAIGARKAEEDAVRSAEILTGSNAALLRQLLLRGEQRISDMEVYQLYKKNIIRLAGDARSGVYEIVDPVWDDRERLIRVLETRMRERHR